MNACQRTRVILCVARGGFFKAGTPQAESEHVETYLRSVLNFMGVTDLAVIAADGVAVGPDHREAGTDVCPGRDSPPASSRLKLFRQPQSWRWKCRASLSLATIPTASTSAIRVPHRGLISTKSRRVRKTA
ncbi:MAG: NAD(P)H-dependent oxidoreductase [Acidobacteriales bacterium]|nr:NAD(P)H-dependent oxidoreductase [Terriglobales bacterium]